MLLLQILQQLQIDPGNLCPVQMSMLQSTLQQKTCKNYP